MITLKKLKAKSLWKIITENNLKWAIVLKKNNVKQAKMEEEKLKMRYTEHLTLLYCNKIGK